MAKREAHPLTQFKLNMLPFADAGSDGLPLKRLLRLSLFQISCGLATAMLLGTLNRVMIVELSVPALLVALMVALPVLIAPFRALLGFRSDNYRSSIGWKRVPYMWFGSLWQFGGLSIMPFAILILSGSQEIGPSWSGEVLAALAFLMTGVGLHMTQTAGLALASDQATDETRPRVVALLYMMFLLGIGVSAVVVGALLENFSELRLVQVIQGTALVTLLLNIVAVWKQESVRPMTKAERAIPKPKFSDAWADFASGGLAGRLLLIVALVAAKLLAKGVSPYRLASWGLLFGIAAFGAVIGSEFVNWIPAFFVGAAMIGFGAGLFAVAMLTGAMTMPVAGKAGRGLALGAWGAAQATAVGLGVALGGGMRDGMNWMIESGVLGASFSNPSLSYSVVYQAEIVLLIVTLVLIGPLLRSVPKAQNNTEVTKIGLTEFPT